MCGTSIKSYVLFYSGAASSAAPHHITHSPTNFIVVRQDLPHTYTCGEVDIVWGTPSPWVPQISVSRYAHWESNIILALQAPPHIREPLLPLTRFALFRSHVGRKSLTFPYGFDFVTLPPPQRSLKNNSKLPRPIVKPLSPFYRLLKEVCVPLIEVLLPVSTLIKLHTHR